jgi:beta-mannosidase
MLPNPKLWQPNGLGDPNLYTVKLSLKRAGKAADAIQFDYGIRSIERVASAGPRIADRWENWQFVVNGRKIFVKGMNFTPQDILLDLPKERYRWTLEAARKMGVQLIRIWGGGLLESDYLYEICDELGIMVWQDFPIGNQGHARLPAGYLGGPGCAEHCSVAQPSITNGFGVAAMSLTPIRPATRSQSVSSNVIWIFSTSNRLFVRTTPDDGSMHTYPDMDPSWYNRSYKLEPWVSETGMHSIPEASLFYETVNNNEFVNLGKNVGNKFWGISPGVYSPLYRIWPQPCTANVEPGVRTSAIWPIQPLNPFRKHLKLVPGSFIRYFLKKCRVIIPLQLR